MGLVYRDRTERCSSRDLVRALERLSAEVRRTGAHDTAIELLIQAGQLESALLDADQPDRERATPLRTGLDAISRAAGRIAAATWTRRTPRSMLDDFDAALRRSGLRDDPRAVVVKTPEGYAWYAAHPEAWLAGAARADQRRPVVILGLRSIGTSLSAIAAAHFEPSRVLRMAIRPRGHPFDRRLALEPALERQLRAHADGTFLVVDEGPGLSGSSLTCAAQLASSFGVPDSRILLLPAWVPDASQFVSEHVRANWDRWRKIVVTPEEVGLTRELLEGEEAPREWSGGAWRTEVLGGSGWPAVQPQHERRKWRTARGVLRFIGLGGDGRRLADRIQRMREAGFGPPLLNVRHGYAMVGFVRGTVAAPPDDAFVPTVARYLDWVCTEAVPGAVDFDELAELIDVNVREAFDVAPPRLERFRRAVEEGAPVRIDGRLQPHEWVRSPDGWVKLDGFDHHADHFYPGAQDVAWDLAGLAAEHSLALRDAVLERMSAAVPSERLRFYDLAYGAFRLAYARMAVDATSGDERERWLAERDRHARFVRGAMERLA